MSKSYELSTAAEKDWQDIVGYTLKNFGERQVLKYTSSLISCLDNLAFKKGRFRELEIKKYTVLVKNCQKHYIFALVRPGKPLLIIAIFHERMDLMQRLKNRLS